MSDGLSFLVEFLSKIKLDDCSITELVDHRRHASAQAFIDNFQTQNIQTLPISGHDLVRHGFRKAWPGLFEVRLFYGPVQGFGAIRHIEP